MGSSAKGGGGGGKGGGGSSWSLPNTGGSGKATNPYAGGNKNVGSWSPGGGKVPDYDKGGSQNDKAPRNFGGPPISSPQPQLPPMPVINSRGTTDTKTLLEEQSKLAFSDKELAGYDAAREAKYGGGSNNLSLLGDDEEDTLSEVDTWF